MSAASGWAEQTERGAPLLTRAALSLVRRLGWQAGRPIALIAALWFLLTAPVARAASHDYLRRVLGRPVGVADVARHFAAFAVAVLDRVMLACGRADEFDIEVIGLPRLVETLERRTGAVLLGAHVGSFEILRTLADQAPVPVWAVMYRRNGGALTDLLDRTAPALRERVIEIGDAASMLQARECVERGEMVGILADRDPTDQRSIPVPFLGGTASFPAGPLLLAATLGAPVFFCYGVRLGRGRYRVGIEPFSPRIVLRREHRAADLAAEIGRYAACVDRLCRDHPFQWFNFFPFWTETDATNPARSPAAPASAALRPG